MILHLLRPQTTCRCIPVKFGEIFPQRQTVAVHLWHLTSERNWKYTCRCYVQNNYCNFFFIHAQDMTEFVKEQLKDQILQILLRDNSTSLKLTKIRVPNSSLDIVCDTSTEKIRPFIPESFRRIFFSSLHNLSHPGANASIKLMTERYVWLRMKLDIRLWAKTCEQCQKAKVRRYLLIISRLPVNDSNTYL